MLKKKNGEYKNGEGSIAPWSLGEVLESLDRKEVLKKTKNEWEKVLIHKIH